MGCNPQKMQFSVGKGLGGHWRGGRDSEAGMVLPRHRAAGPAYGCSFKSSATFPVGSLAQDEEAPASVGAPQNAPRPCRGGTAPQCSLLPAWFRAAPTPGTIALGRRVTYQQPFSGSKPRTGPKTSALKCPRPVPTTQLLSRPPPRSQV